MTAWIVATALYLIGAFEVYKVRCPGSEQPIWAQVVGIIFWPVFVPIAALVK